MIDMRRRKERMEKPEDRMKRWVWRGGEKRREGCGSGGEMEEAGRRGEKMEDKREREKSKRKEEVQHQSSECKLSFTS